VNECVGERERERERVQTFNFFLFKEIYYYDNLKQLVALFMELVVKEGTLELFATLFLKENYLTALLFAVKIIDNSNSSKTL
jgi:hypothetical protein